MSNKSTSTLLFKEVDKPPMDKGYFIGTQPSQIFWDDDKIFLASKRAYSIMNKSDGTLLYKYEIDSKGKRILCHALTFI